MASSVSISLIQFPRLVMYMGCLLTQLFKVNSEQIDLVRDHVWELEPWWLYNITSAPNKELNNAQVPLYLGSMVGGSSAVNGMQSIRGTSEDYDRWGSFFGESSTWSWEGMLLYFKKVRQHFGARGGLRPICVY